MFESAKLKKAGRINPTGFGSEPMGVITTKGRMMKAIKLSAYAAPAVLIALLNPQVAVASDLSIYEGASQDTPAIVLMLDTSGSMARYDIGEPYNYSSTQKPDQCSFRYNSQTSDPYNKYPWSITYWYCGFIDDNPNTSANEKEVFSRIDGLKMAVFDIAEKLVGEKYKLGIGTYPNPKFSGGAFTSNSEEWAQGAVSIPALLMTESHKDLIQNYVKDITANAGTPLAHGYAEAAAYMLGTTTSDGTAVDTAVTPKYFVDDRSGRSSEYLYRCKSPDKTRTINRGGTRWYDCQQSQLEYVGRGSCRDIENLIRGEWDTGFGDKTGGGNCRYRGDYYYGLAPNQSGVNAYSGFRFSDNSTKAGAVYQSPLEGSSAECSSNGIFLLTDGVPNASSNTISKTLMDRALGGSNPISCSNNLLYSGADDSGWRCMGDLSQKLINKQNKGKRELLTATVGFGAEYAGLKDGSGKPITETKDRSVCFGYGTTDQRNLCLLGVAGEGGFYSAAEREGVVTAVEKFLADVTVDIPAVSTGTMAVPVDSLDLVGDTRSIYLPVLDPKVGKPQLWPGNLKKYSIKNNRIVGADGNSVFSDSKGNFATNTRDVWSFFDVDDQALPQKGGAYSQIFKNQVVDAEKNIVKEKGRRAFTDYYDETNATLALSNVKVTGTQLSGFTKLSGFAERTKLAILNFLGYPVTDNFLVDENGEQVVITDDTRLEDENGQAIPLNENLKTLGGVLHSTPQLITYRADFDENGSITTREDYIIYGSMDGALHVVDDKTGKEALNFLPSQVLRSQGEVYIDPETAFGGQPNGVDGPWSTYATYKRDNGAFVANEVIVSGGLRMGGSTQYALDLSDLSNPKILYAVGSDYAENEYGQGLLPAAPVANKGANNAFKRMGQSWGRPTQGKIKYSGKEVVVNFLPGGYDACYEKPEFKLGSGSNLTCSKSSAQGNAVYMVGLGELTTLDNQEQIDTGSSTSGQLLWWASSNAEDDGSAKFTLNDQLRHSVVTTIQGLDRDYDGLTDHLYFADLGGQIFRVDIDNSGDTFEVERVVRLLDASGATSGSDAAPRFYERPTVSFTRMGNKVVGLVTAGTGDRSSPLAARNTANRLYNLIDKDVTKNDLFTNPNVVLETKDVRPADSAGALPPKVLNQLTLTVADSQALRRAIDNNLAQGWYFVADRFDGASSKKGLKVFNEQDVLKGFLYFNIFNPEGSTLDADNQCGAGIRGSSERQILCLPYGTCDGFETKLESESSGTGIVDTWIVKSDGLIGRLSTDPDSPGLDEKAISNGSGGTGGSETGGPDINSGFPGERVLKPLEWLQKQ